MTKQLRSLALLVIAILALSLSISQQSHAVSGWNAGDIMSDGVMANDDTMSVTQIQTFLSKHVPTCQTQGVKPYPQWVIDSGYVAPFICLKGYYESPTSTYTVNYTRKDKDNSCKSTTSKITYTTNNYYKITGFTVAYKNGCEIKSVRPIFKNVNNTKPTGAKSAAQLIYNAAKDYGINPQVLLVTLNKEQSLVDDNWPTPMQYYSATGYQCTDSAPCDPSYANFNQQVRAAAAHFRAFLNGNYYSGFHLGSGNNIPYSPDCSTSSSVTIKNLATLALYTYTPYQPNTYALNGGTLSGSPYCGAFGNLNFYKFFTSWFGSTHYAVQGSIGKYYNSGDVATTLGNPIENESKTANGGYKQCFDNGCIVGSSDTGYWMVKGSIGTYYWKIKGASGRMGLPLANEVNAGNSMYYQKYQGGYIAGRRDTGYWDVKGSIAKSNPPSNISTLGVPTEDEVNVSEDAWKQCFDNGCIVGSSKTGYWPIKGSISKYYWTNDGVTGKLGLPLAGEVKHSDDGVYYQKYQKGYIIGQHSTGYWSVKGSIRTTYDTLGAYNSSLGIPLSDEQKSDDGIYTQQYQNGYIVGKSGSYCESSGKIRDYWVSLGSWSGEMGLITGPLKTGERNMSYQHYEKGVLILNPNTDQVWESKGSIRAVWAKLGYQTGRLGFPTGPEVNTNGIWSQTYEHGVIETKAGKEYKVTYTS